MYRSRWLSAVLAAAMVLAACGGGGTRDSAAQPPVDPNALERRGFVESDDGRLRISGKSPLVVSIRAAAGTPELPAGWEALAPVYDVTARDRLHQPVTELSERLSVAFEVRPGVAATVLMYDLGVWSVVPSETAGSKVTALIDHLTPYTIAAPLSAQSPSQGPLPVRSPSPAPSGTPTPASPATTTARTRATATPSAAVTAGTMGPAQAQAALETAIERLKGKKTRVENATGYTGALVVPLPAALQQSLGAALGAGGAASYGLYNGINQAVSVSATGNGVSGSLTLLAEPKTQMPADERAAREQIAQYFPAVPPGLTVVMADSSGYAFTVQSGGTTYAAGILSLNGTAIAYAAAGSGSYAVTVK